MKNFFSVKKIKETVQDPAEPRNMRAIAIVFWRSLILAACLVSLGSILYGVWLFQTSLAELDAAESPPSVPKAAFDKTVFKAIVSSFSDRQLQYQIIEAAPPAVDDPVK